MTSPTWRFRPMHLLACLVAVILVMAVPWRAEKPPAPPSARPAQSAPPPVAPVIPPPPLPASAFQASKAFLRILNSIDADAQRVALASLVAERVPARLQNDESVTIDAEIALTASDASQGRAAVDQLVGALKRAAGVVDVRVANVPAKTGAKQPSGAQLVRVGVSWSPALAPARGERAESASANAVANSYAYIRRQSCVDGVEIGDVNGDLAESRIPHSVWMEERWTIHPRDPARVLAALRIHHFAAALEREHGHASVTRFAMLAPKDRVEKAGYLRMELELTVLRPARPDELTAAQQP